MTKTCFVASTPSFRSLCDGTVGGRKSVVVQNEKGPPLWRPQGKEKEAGRGRRKKLLPLSTFLKDHGGKRAAVECVCTSKASRRGKLRGARVMFGKEGRKKPSPPPPPLLSSLLGLRVCCSGSIHFRRLFVSH